MSQSDPTTGLANLESALLRACGEAIRRQQELVPQLASTLGVPSGEVFYYWMDREFPRVSLSEGEEWRLQVGQIDGSEWEYFFHGYECDLMHSDGRLVRVEFGPRGRLDCLSSYAALQFVMASRPPWPEFPELRSYLAEKPPPYHASSGSIGRINDLWERLVVCHAFTDSCSVAPVLL